MNFYRGHYKSGCCLQIEAASTRQQHIPVTRREKLREGAQRGIRSVLLVSRGFIPCLSCNGIGNWITRVQCSFASRRASDRSNRSVVRPPHSAHAIMNIESAPYPSILGGSYIFMINLALDKTFSLLNAGRVVKRNRSHPTCGRASMCRATCVAYLLMELEIGSLGITSSRAATFLARILSRDRSATPLR